MDEATNPCGGTVLQDSVAEGQAYGELIAMTDSEDEIIRRIKMFDSELYTKKASSETILIHLKTKSF